MANPTHLLKDFLEGFEALGYRRWDRFKPFSRRDIWYYRPNPGNCIYSVAYLGYQPRAMAYGITLGIFSDKELGILEKCRSIIAFSLHPVIIPDLSMLISWMLFTLGDAREPRLLSIPDPLNRYSWQCQVTALKKDYLVPHYWPTEDASQVQALLLSTQKPFEWNVGQPVLRAAQCLALALSDGGIEDDLCRQLLALRLFLPTAGGVHENWPNIINYLVEGFRNQG